MIDILQIGDSGSGICRSHNSTINVTGILVEGFIGFERDSNPISGNNHTVQLSCGHTGKLIASVNDITCNDVIIGKSGDSWGPGTGNTTGTITITAGGVAEDK